MNISNNKKYYSFNYPPQIARLVVCDFDETYMPYSIIKKKNSGIHELECYINGNNNRLLLLFGWVTGSSLKAVLRKSEGYITYLPHFISSSLGSELYWIKNGVIQESDEWKQLIVDSGFNKKNIKMLVDEIHSRGVLMPKQIEDYQGKYMESYYYHFSENTNEDLQIIKDMALDFNIKVLFTICNPAAGDPSNCFDVQFMPKCCGKKEVLDFLSASFNITQENTWAFGDSYNDYEVLISAGNSFLVSNADPNLKLEMPTAVLRSNYCHGIKEALNKIEL